MDRPENEWKDRKFTIWSLLCFLGGNRKIDKFAKGGILAIIIGVLLAMQERQNIRISDGLKEGLKQIATSLDKMSEKFDDHARDDLITELALKLQEIGALESKKSTINTIPRRK